MRVDHQIQKKLLVVSSSQNRFLTSVYNRKLHKLHIARCTNNLFCCFDASTKLWSSPLQNHTFACIHLRSSRNFQNYFRLATVTFDCRPSHTPRKRPSLGNSDRWYVQAKNAMLHLYVKRLTIQQIRAFSILWAYCTEWLACPPEKISPWLIVRLPCSFLFFAFVTHAWASSWVSSSCSALRKGGWRRCRSLPVPWSWGLLCVWGFQWWGSGWVCRRWSWFIRWFMTWISARDISFRVWDGRCISCFSW